MANLFSPSGRRWRAAPDGGTLGHLQGTHRYPIASHTFARFPRAKGSARHVLLCGTVRPIGFDTRPSAGAHPPLPCRASPPQGGRSDGGPLFSTIRFESGVSTRWTHAGLAFHRGATSQNPGEADWLSGRVLSISPLEGGEEWSAKRSNRSSESIAATNTGRAEGGNPI